MNKKLALWIAGGVLAASVLLVGILSVFNGYFILAPAVQLRLNGESVQEIAAYSDYEDEGATARKGKQDLSGQVVAEGAVDVTVPGTYTLTYRLMVGDKEYMQQRTVTVVDREAPVVELTGDTELTISARQLYQEPGYTASDSCDGDLTEKVTVTEILEGETLTLTYTVSDAAGNESSARRVVTIRDMTAPVLSLSGYSTVYVPVGGSYKEPGYSASDDADGDLTAAVVCSGGVDTAAAGTYTIRYQVSDKAGNNTEAKRTVKVYDNAPNSGDRVYLTFDDGPSSYVTEEILDILAANDVQATFFILNYSQSNKYLVARMINEGHTVAIHGYSHDYASIYASDEAFMENVYRLKDKLLADFGYNATIIRFPGGSSNTVSAAYNTGIMSRLTSRLEQEGFAYFDWNISSGDASAGGVTSAQIYHNVTDSLRRGRNNVVLMHDTNAKQTTADALQDIIHYAKGNGYMLLPITQDTTPVHHGVNN